MIHVKDDNFYHYELTAKKSILLVLNYFIGYQGVYVGLAMFISSSLGLNRIPTYLIFGVYLLTLVVSITLVKDWLILQWESRIKDNFWKTILTQFILLFTFNILINIVFSTVLGITSNSGNQDIVIESMLANPILNSFATIIFAPIVEEIVFRGALYDFIKKYMSKRNAVIVSCILFGSIHVIPVMMMSGDISELIYLIPYSGMAYFMIRAYDKTASIWGAIGVHMLNNTVATTAIIISMFM